MRFFESARELFMVEIDDFDRQARMLQFPWLNRPPATETPAAKPPKANAAAAS